jgi:hypothetical protein
MPAICHPRTDTVTFLYWCFTLSAIQTYAQDYTITSYNISGGKGTLNVSVIQATLSNVVTISLNSTSSVAVLVESCQAGTYSLLNSQTCNACPKGKYSSTVLANSPDTCLSCEAGKYSNATAAANNMTCLSCPANTYFSGTAGTDISVCVSCPANSWSYEASKLLDSCICSPGYSGSNGKNPSFYLAYLRLFG